MSVVGRSAAIVLLGVGEVGAAELLPRLGALLATPPAELVLCHVIDTGVRGGLDLAHGFGPHRAVGRHRARIVADAERVEAAGILAEAMPSAARIATRAVTEVGEGEPGRAVCAVAAERGADLVVVGARDHPDDRGSTGPHSVGHTARFVLDHAPCPVLLLRAAV
ncbi:MAG: universal stress protein [Candidatus Dormiibacterota bacterium]